MTSLSLLLWIVGGVLLQIAAYLALGFWRHWQAYEALRTVAAEFDIAVDPAAATPEMAPTAVAAWPGYRSFHVERKVPEDSAGQVCSFYLVPEDGKPLPPFLPGQFLTFQLDIPAPAGGTQTVVRCYSLSDAPQPNRYRISVKRAPSPIGSAHPPGASSNYFHDLVEVGSTLKVRAPGGHFHIDRSDAPVVLIGGGVGITPMLSMLNWCLTAQPGREVWLFYGVRNRVRAGDADASGRDGRATSELSPAPVPERPAGGRPGRAQVGVVPHHHTVGWMWPAAPSAAAQALPLLHLRPHTHAAKPGARAGRLGRAGRADPLRGVWPGIHHPQEIGTATRDTPRATTRAKLSW